VALFAAGRLRQMRGEGGMSAPHRPGRA